MWSFGFFEQDKDLIFAALNLTIKNIENGTSCINKWNKWINQISDRVNFLIWSLGDWFLEMQCNSITYSIVEVVGAKIDTKLFVWIFAILICDNFDYKQYTRYSCYSSLKLWESIKKSENRPSPTRLLRAVQKTFFLIIQSDGVY